MDLGQVQGLYQEAYTAVGLELYQELYQELCQELYQELYPELYPEVDLAVAPESGLVLAKARDYLASPRRAKDKDNGHSCSLHDRWNRRRQLQAAPASRRRCGRTRERYASRWKRVGCVLRAVRTTT